MRDSALDPLLHKLAALRPIADLRADYEKAAELKHEHVFYERQMDQLGRDIALAELRDGLLMFRPEGCFCLGNGVVHGDGVMRFCGCPEGHRLYDEVEVENAKAREAKLEHRREILGDNSNVPVRFWNHRFDTYPDQDSPTLAKVRDWTIPPENLEQQEAWSANRKDSLFLYGKFGTGKTGLAVASLWQRIEMLMDDSCMYTTTTALLDRIRATYGNDGTGDDALIEQVATVELLVLDDIGAERVTDWVSERLFALVNERHSQMRSTIFTSNLSPIELAAHVGERTAWRVVEMCDVVKVEGRNLRA